MRHVRGYVCLGRFEYQNILYGKSRNIRGQLYENLLTNNFTTFSTRRETQEIAEEIRRNFQDILSIAISRIEMQIQENDAELEKFKRRRNLIVIGHLDTSDQLYGTCVGEYPTAYPIPADYLTGNGFKTFQSFERAEYVGREINRQAKSGARLATFKLTNL